MAFSAEEEIQVALDILQDGTDDSALVWALVDLRVLHADALQDRIAAREERFVVDRLRVASMQVDFRT